MKYKYDFHCHTKEGSMDSSASIFTCIEVLKDKGFSGMLVTDHNSYDGYREWKYENSKESQCNYMSKLMEDFVVLKGIEYDTFDAGHILIIMPENVNLPILEARGMRVKQLIKIVHKNGGIIGPSHPCGEPFLSIFSTGKYSFSTKIMKEFDFVEGYNSREYDADNLAARKLAKRYGKPVFGGSDAHEVESLGMGYTVLSRKVRTQTELINYVKALNSMNYDKLKNDEYRIKCGGKRYDKTIRDRLGAANKLLVYGFFIYNKVMAAISFVNYHLNSR